MGRLTDNTDCCFLHCGEAGIPIGEKCCLYKNCLTRLMYVKLKHYEDIEEQGRLVEVIKCSECEHYDNVGCADGCGWCDYWDIGRFTDGYCDKAERLYDLEGVKE